MKGSSLTLFLLGISLSLVSAQTLTTTNLPILRINTNGQTIVDEPKITALMQIIDNGVGQLNNVNDTPTGFDGKVGIEIRGSSSQSYEKKPYTIETLDALGASKDFSLLGMPKENDWALVAPLNDKTLMRDVMAYSLAAEVLPWAPRTRYVEVIINGQYEGIYILLEKIKRDQNRVNISKLKPTDLAGDSLTGGYILKMDKLNQGPGGDWVSDYPPFVGSQAQTYFQLHYPKNTDIQPAQRYYIENYLRTFEDSMYQWKPNSVGIQEYENWIDVDSWINYLLINEVSKNTDGYRLSSYFYKDRDDVNGKLVMGPVWDYNIAFGIGDYCEGQFSNGWAKDFNSVCPNDGWVIHFWWEKLFRDTLFQQKVVSRWQDLRSTIWTNDLILSKIDSISTLLNAKQAQSRNFLRWPVLNEYVWPNSFIGGSHLAEVNFLKSWMIDRLAWMDGNITKIGPTVSISGFNYLDKAEVFPNPVRQNGELTIKYSSSGVDGATISLFDSSGRIVLEPQTLPNGQREEYKLSLRNLHAGVYFYRIEAYGKKLKIGSIEIF
jgi:CotH kinase protein/Secretion system C-terminal sorting domain